MFIEILRRLHRWISLILAPLFLVIVVSGALLTLEPIRRRRVTAARAGGHRRPDSTLDRLDVARTVRALDVDLDGASAELKFEHGTAPVRIDIASGAVLAGSSEGVSLPCCMTCTRPFSSGPSGSWNTAPGLGWSYFTVLR